MSKQIFLFGAGGHGESVAGVIEAEEHFEIAGLIDSVYSKGTVCFGYDVLGRESDFIEIIHNFKIKEGIVCVGDNFQRKAFMERIKARVPDFKFITSVHPSAAVSKSTVIGPGTVVMAQAAVNPGCRIGSGCIVNTSASLDHNSIMEDFSSLAPGVTVGGRTRIGLCAAIGLGANLLEKITIGDHAVIGAGSLVNRDIESNRVAYGVPARVIRKRNSDEPYLK